MSNEKTSKGIKIQEVKKKERSILMKEKHKNGCNILIMSFTNLEKYVYSKKCLKQRRQPPHPPSSKVEGIFSPLFSHSRKEIEKQPCMEEGGVRIFFLIATIISFLRRKSAVR